MNKFFTNKKIISSLVSGMLFFFTVPTLTGDGAKDRFGIEELNHPDLFFIHAGAFETIYDVKHVESGANPIDEHFIGLVEQRKFKETEKWLIERYDHPYYLVNLILFYLYLNQPGYVPLFETWQNSAALKIQENLVRYLYNRKMKLALDGFSTHWKNPDLNFYSLFEIYRLEGKVSQVEINFFNWKKQASKDEFAGKLFEKAKIEWSYDSNNVSPETGTGKPSLKNKVYNFSVALSENDCNQIEQDLIQQKITRDVFSAYINNLRTFGQAERAIHFISKAPFLSAEEKDDMLSQFEQPIPTPETAKQAGALKLKIRH